MSTMVSKSKAKRETKRFDPAKLKPYNRFNLFFIVSSTGIRKDTHRQFNVARPNLPPNTQLERELILQSNPDYKPSSAELRRPHFVTGYEDVEIPFSLPSRYAQITIPEGWYLPGRNKTRPHTKSKNLIPFTELSKMIARNYKNVDEETFNYLDAISTSMIKRSKELLGSRNSNAHCIQQQVSLSNRTEDEVAPLNHLKSLSFKAQLMQLLPQLQMASAMQRDVVGLNLTYADYKTIGTGQTVVPRHHFVEASAAPPFASYSRPLFEDIIGHSFYSGPPSLAQTGLRSSCGSFSSAGSSSETSVFSIPASHRLAKPSTGLDSTTVCAVRPEGCCIPSDDGFDRLDRLETAWATRRERRM